MLDEMGIDVRCVKKDLNNTLSSTNKVLSTSLKLVRVPDVEWIKVNKGMIRDAPWSII
jgi:hypothetical protein